MKVIFKKDNSIKDVNEGYVRNYLLPKGLAIIATPAEIQKRQFQLKAEEEQRKQQDQADKALIQELDGKEYTISTSKIGANGKLNGALTAKEISEKTQINKLYLQVSAPIKESGSHTIPLKIGQYHGRITITIVKEGAL
jgi:large subunit ribosomal protein L9